MTSPTAVPPASVVWLVEDNPDYRQTVRELLDGRPTVACPHAFGTCEELLAALDAHPPPDLVLMDIGLPGMTGIEGVRRLRAAAPSTHVIMLTIHQRDETIFEAICAGASGYLLKTARADEIFGAVEEVRRGGAAMTGQIARRVLDRFAQEHAPARDYQLSRREREILELLVEGSTKQQVADALTLSFHTIDTHVRNIYTKLHVTTRADAVAKAVRERLV